MAFAVRGVDTVDKTRRASIEALSGARYDSQRAAWIIPSVHRDALQAILTGRGPLPLPVAPAARSSTARLVFHTDPWRHQRDAVANLYQRQAILLDAAMGTGKSKIVLDICHNRSYQTVLVVCPKPIVPVWVQQVERHLPQTDWLAVPLDTGSTRRNAQRAKNVIDRRRHMPMRLLFVINYASFWRSPVSDVLLSTHFDAIVAEESHHLSSAGARQSRFIARLARAHPTAQLFALSGTPLPNSILDAYGTFRFLDPAVFGTRYADFKARYAVISPYNQYVVTGYQNQDEFHRKYGSLRYHIPNTVLDLPPVHHIDVPVIIPPGARAVYADLYKTFVAHIQDGTVTTDNALTHVLRLQQVTSGFAVLDDAASVPPSAARLGLAASAPRGQTPVHSAKRDMLTELLRDAPPSPVVVFCRFLYDLAQTASGADRAGRAYYELSSARKDLRGWLSNASGVFGVQIQAGAEGLNDLVHAHHAVFFSPPVSLAKFDQAVARLNRPGQARPVTIWHLVCPGTIDTQTYAALQARRDVIKTIVEGSRAARHPLT